MSGIYGYIVSTHTAVASHVRDDGAIVSWGNKDGARALREGLDVESLVWVTQRELASLAHEHGLMLGSKDQGVEVIPLVGMNGHVTPIGKVLFDAVSKGGRNGQSYTTLEFCSKKGFGMTPETGAALYEKVVAFYADDAELAEAAA